MSQAGVATTLDHLGLCTRDLGGTASTSSYTAAVLTALTDPSNHPPLEALP